MSDGRIKLANAPAAPTGAAADAPALDDIILGDDDHTIQMPAPARGAAAAAQPAHDNDALAKAIEAGASTDSRERLSNIPPGTDPSKDARKVKKMTLRIPDDEVSRPQLPATTPMGGIPALGPSRTPASADDTLELPAVDADGSVRRAPGIDGGHEAGWTPYQPQVLDPVSPGPQDSTDGGPAKLSRPRDPALTIVDEQPGFGAMTTRAEQPSAPPVSEDIPVDTDDDEPNVNGRFDEAQTSPRLPSALDSEDIGVDDEDLVSVESIANAQSPHAPPPLKGGAKPVPAPAPSGLTATALMAGVSPIATAPAQVGAASGGPLGVTPRPIARSPQPGSVPPAAPAAPVAAQPPAQPPAQPSAPDDSYTAPPAGTPMARRQQPDGGPFGYMTPVGALAPPPMHEAAANRKKIRPWWEDLFNDDFIRTMAKITDADIAREANFIEESLGCEAGATILDLACGTGRHAVELASRGYQVVGFDLSLAMLARASDEAQDRKQKINFVQGDMREMTFDETFDGVFAWNTSFGFFDEEKNAAVIAKVHRALKKGGQFLLDVVNRDSLIRSAPSLAWFEGDGCICMDEMQIDFITSRMKVKRTLMMDDGRTKEIEYSIRVYSLHELGKMLHDNGFRVAEVSGRTGTPGVFFGCESPRTLILAEKR